MLDELGRGALEEARHAVVLLLVVDDRAVELLLEHVAQYPDREVRLLENHVGRLDLVGPALDDLIELLQILDVALEVGLARSLGGRANDDTPVALEDLLQQLSLPLTLGLGQSPAGADATAGRHVHEVTPGDRELHRKARPLGLERVLDDLHQDLLLGLEELVDALAPTATASRRRLTAWQHDLVDVEEAVSLQADVDERGLHSGKHVVDDALVDVSNDRSLAAALDVELGHLQTIARLLRDQGARRATGRPALAGRAGRTLFRALSRRALAFEHRDAGLARVD